MAITEEILVCCAEPAVDVFFPLLEKGVGIDAIVGVTLRKLLAEQLNIAPAYIDAEIQTIFVNARAIDDLERTVVRAGDELALSGAMPGLVGATFRRGGRYAVMRREISGDLATESLPQASGRLTLKLFNTVLGDLGAKILARGVWAKGEELLALFEGSKKRLQDEAVSLRICMTEVRIADVGDRIDRRKDYFMKVTSQDSEPEHARA